MVVNEITNLINTTLGLNWSCQAISWDDQLSRMIEGHFHISWCQWCLRINDPYYTLEPFKDVSNNMNFSNFTDPLFSKLIKQAELEVNTVKRIKLLHECEKILIQQMPAIPVCFAKHKSIKSKKLRNVISSDISNFDFKYAYISHEEINP